MDRPTISLLKSSTLFVFKGPLLAYVYTMSNTHKIQ